MTEGRKDDTGKVRTDLLPVDALLGIADVFSFGASKYGVRNWERGIVFSRLYAALLRHLFAYWGGEQTDRESGKSHLAHAGCCLLMLMALSERGNASLDDRPVLADGLLTGPQAT
jgi:Domain of unknown function (DUF5664)